ncbi:MAG: DUF433 domain-containing protein [Cyanobacteriota bacterium]|nr:DUF433 domain-containing protein [Cyanobacteriota bacterium]
MSAYSLKLPSQLREAATKRASLQGISLEQFILNAISDKLAAEEEFFNQPNFPEIIYIRGTSGFMVPVLKGTRIRIQTLAIAKKRWNLSEEQIAEEYNLSLDRVRQALLFYSEFREEIEEAIANEQTIERANV